MRAILNWDQLTPVYGSVLTLSRLKINPHAQKSQKSFLDQLLLSRLEAAYGRLIQLESRPVFRRPLERIRDSQRRIDELESYARKAIDRKLEKAQQSVASLSRHLESVSPLAVLSRGYSVTQLAANKDVVTSVDKIKKGDLIETQVSDGIVVSSVESTKKSSD